MNRAVVITGGNGVTIDNDIVTVVDDILRRLGRVTASSSVYRTPPYGFEADRDFLNQVLVVETDLTPYMFLKEIWRIEASYGRDRGGDEEEAAKWEARKRGERGYCSRDMDIDILFWNNDVIHTELLAIPHPSMCEREFVMRPLAEVLPDFVHPVVGKSVGDIFGELISGSVGNGVQ